MSYARFGSTHVPGHAPSDVYVFATAGGVLECCGCRIALASVHLRSMAEASEHFVEHEKAGHSCGEPWANMLGEIRNDAGAIWRGEPFDFQIVNARDHVRALEAGAVVRVRVDLPGGHVAEYDARVMGAYGTTSMGGVIIDLDSAGMPRISES